MPSRSPDQWNSTLCSLAFSHEACLLPPAEKWYLPTLHKSCATALSDLDVSEGILAQQLWLHVLRDGSRETESVWGHAEWETSILFGHTADIHSSCSEALLDRLPYAAAQASLTSTDHFSHQFQEVFTPQLHAFLCLEIYNPTPASAHIAGSARTRRRNTSVNIYCLLDTSLGFYLFQK